VTIDYVYPVCSGENCGRKTICRRFKRDINKKKEQHLAWPPIKPDGSCASFRQKPNDPFIEKLREILGGNENNTSQAGA
jgi:hypothetical protein